MTRILKCKKISICFLNPRRLKERRWLFQIVEYSESQLVSGWFPAGSTQTQPRRDTNSIIITQERTHRLLMTLEVKHIWLEEPLRLLLRNGAEQEQQCNKRPSEWNTVLLGLESTALAKINGIFHINKGNKSRSNSSNVSRVSSYCNFFNFKLPISLHVRFSILSIWGSWAPGMKSQHTRSGCRGGANSWLAVFNPNLLQVQL